METLNVMIVGVGGQGTLLTSRVIGSVGIGDGHDVKVSEVHGMSQRGGSVVTYVRIGDKVDSPIIEKGQADVIIAFEELEALRWFDYIKDDGLLIINNQKINPMPVIIGKAKYPDQIIDRIKANFNNVIVIPALRIAEECGNIKAVNMVLVGVLANYLKINKNLWIDALILNVPQKFLELNLQAFERGYNGGIDYGK